MGSDPSRKIQVRSGQASDQFHPEINFMKVPKHIGPDVKISKGSPGVMALRRGSSQRLKARETRYLTCNEHEVDDLLSKGEST